MINWEKSETARCRWGDEAMDAFNAPKILWEDSHADYQGHAKFFGWTGAAVVFYEWTYGSCSGCDPWEDQFSGLEGSARLAATMRGGAVWFDTLEPLLVFAEPLFMNTRDWNTFEEDKIRNHERWKEFVLEVEGLLK